MSVIAALKGSRSCALMIIGHNAVEAATSEIFRDLVTEVTDGRSMSAGSPCIALIESKGANGVIEVQGTLQLTSKSEKAA